MHIPWLAWLATLHYMIDLIGSSRESKEEENQKDSTPNVIIEDKNEGVKPEEVDPECSLASGCTSTESITSRKQSSQIYP